MIRLLIGREEEEYRVRKEDDKLEYRVRIEDKLENRVRKERDKLEYRVQKSTTAQRSRAESSQI
jgi:hypothetical protein